jgi:hypothetical protein
MEANATTLAVGAYVAWLLAVVLLVAGRYTPAPLLPGVHTGVVTGAVVLTAVGAVRLGRRALRGLAG